MAQLSHEQLVASYNETVCTPRRRYGVGAKILFVSLDVVYGKPRTLSKFKVLELIARVPYQAWEQVAYIAITHTAGRPGFARRVFDRVTESRGQQDNEQWHLLILEELIAEQGVQEGWVKGTVIPQGGGVCLLPGVLVAVRSAPAWSYRLNADFEDHAEHEYVHLIDEHPEWEHEAFESAFAADYAQLDSLADLFRQISYDERIHKNESEAAMSRSRFS